MTDSPLTPAADPSDYTPRYGLQRTIKYRNVLRLSYYGLLLTALGALLAGFTYMGLSIAENEPLDPRILLALLVVVPVVGVGLARWRLRPYAFTAVHVKPDGFTKVRPWDSTEVLFSNVKQLNAWHVPYLGGRFVIVEESGARHEFTAALERNEYLLDSLVAARPELIAADKLAKFRRTLVTSDHSWARLTDRVRIRNRELIALFILLPLLGLGVAWPILNPSPQGFAATFVAALSLGLAIFVLNLTLGLLAGTVGEGYLLYRGGDA
ncbi:MAG: hypothetical protein EOP11_03115, partial [Proteobacteria bacterium]